MVLFIGGDSPGLDPSRLRLSGKGRGIFTNGGERLRVGGLDFGDGAFASSKEVFTGT